MFEKFHIVHLGSNHQTKQARPELSRGDRIRKLMKLRDDLLAAQRRAAAGGTLDDDRLGSQSVEIKPVLGRLDERSVDGKSPRTQ